MMQCFLSCDVLTKLELLEALYPINVIEGKPKSIILFVIKFSYLVYKDQYEQINREWRGLTLQDASLNAQN